MHLQRDPAPTDLANLLRRVPHSRANIFRNISGEDDFDIGGFFLNYAECGAKIVLDSKVRRLLKMVPEFFDALDTLNSKGPYLLVLFDVGKEVQPTAEIHEAIWVDRIRLPLLAVNRIVVHPNSNLFA